MHETAIADRRVRVVELQRLAAFLVDARVVAAAEQRATSDKIDDDVVAVDGASCRAALRALLARCDVRCSLALGADTAIEDINVVVEVCSCLCAF